MILVAFSWRATSARIAALESRLDELVVTLDQRLSSAEWRDELARAAKRLEARVDKRIRSEQRHLTAALDARIEALAISPASTASLDEEPTRREAFAPASREPATAGQLANSAADSVGGSGLEEEEAFDEMFQSHIRSLGLSEERTAEVEAGLEEVLDSLWPEYLALVKSANPDPGDLRRRYCAGMESVLAPEEAAWLGCGEGAVNPSQPAAVETIPEPSPGAG